MKNWILVLILVVSLFTLTGCSDSIGIDNYYYVICLGIDKTDSDLLKISIQVAKSPNDSSGSSAAMSDDYQIYTVEAETIDSGVNIFNNFLNKQVNLSHCSAVIFSEEIAKSGIDDYITALSNNTQLRHSCTVLISETTAYDVMSNVSKSGETYTSRLYDYLTTSTDYTGYSIKSTFGKIFKQLNNNYYQPAIVYTKLSNDTVQNSGIAIFKEDVMVGDLNVLNSVSHLIVTNELERCTISVNSPFNETDKIYMDLHLSKNTDISVSIINNAPFITIDVYPEGNITSSGSEFDYTNNDNISKVQDATNDYLSDLVKEYLYNISKVYNTDIAGLGIKASSNYLTEDEFEQVHWSEIFKDSFFEVNIHTQINSSGLLNKK